MISGTGTCDLDLDAMHESTTQDSSETGPKGLPVVGSTLTIQRDTLGFFDRARKYGGLFSFQMLTPQGKLDVYSVSKPEYVEHVLKNNRKNYRKSGAYSRLGSIMGNGLLVSEGDFWLRQRRLSQPAFHHQRLKLLANSISEATEQMLSERWARFSAGSTIDVSEEMSRLTLTIVGRTLLSTDLANVSPEVGRAVYEMLGHASKRIKAAIALPEYTPTPGNRRFRRALAILDSLVYDIIKEHRAGGEDKGDLVSMLASVRDEETGEKMTDQQLRDEVMTAIIAGHETTAAALSWAWYLLSANPDARRSLEGEAKAVLSESPADFETYQRLEYAQAVFKETLRLYPPAWLIARRANGADQMGPVAISRDDRVVMSPYVTHRDPALWKNPEGFDPSRFMPENAALLPQEEFAYYPFGGGPRQCMGRNLALMEGPVILATIASKYQLDLVPGARVIPEAKVTLRPGTGVPVTLESHAS